MKKFATVVVLYNPTDEFLTSSILALSANLYIVNNSPVSYSHFFFDKKVSCYMDNYNRGGIAGAINKGVTQAVLDGCEYFFTFDQDSSLPDDFFINMESFIVKNNADLVCPNFFDVNSKTYAAFVNLNKFTYDVLNKPEKTDFAISSGMGISKKAWDMIGQLDESYIIDHVDTDFCLRAKELDIPIYVNYDVCLNHAIGNRSVHKFLGVTLKPNHHSKIRKYYICRNGTNLSFRYFFKYPSYFFMNTLRVIHEYVCVILYEESKLDKIKAMTKGIYHSVIGRLGSYEK